MATDVAPVVAPAFVPMGLACVAAGNDVELFDVFVDAALLCVEYDDVCAVDVAAVGDVTAAFCRLAPCALKAERKLPKNGRLVVGMLDICARLRYTLFTSFYSCSFRIATCRFVLITDGTIKRCSVWTCACELLVYVLSDVRP